MTVRLLRQAALVFGAVAVYFLVRGFTEGRPDLAKRNASWLVSAERLLHLDWEVGLQRTVVGSRAATTLFNSIYIYGHWPVIAVVLIWLVIRHPAVFARLRDAMLLSGLAGMVVFATMPVAPPRLAGLPVVDTVTRQSNAYRALQPPALTNQYAAMPSLHVGWNLLVSLAVLVATRRLWVRVLAVAAAMSMDAAVLLTANHYVIDVVAGAALATAAWALVGRRQARRMLHRARCVPASRARGGLSVHGTGYAGRAQSRPPSWRDSKSGRFRIQAGRPLAGRPFGRAGVRPAGQARR